jgi:hypothetical protein
MDYHATGGYGMSGRQIEEDINFQAFAELVGDFQKKPSQAYVFALSH